MTKISKLHAAMLACTAATSGLVENGQEFASVQTHRHKRELVLDHLLRINEAPQGLIVLKAILVLFREGEDLITVPTIRSRPSLAGVSLASIYRTMEVLTSLYVIQLEEYVSLIVTRGPKPQGFSLTENGKEISDALFIELAGATPEVNGERFKSTVPTQKLSSLCEQTPTKLDPSKRRSAVSNAAASPRSVREKVHHI